MLLPRNSDYCCYKLCMQFVCKSIMVCLKCCWSFLHFALKHLRVWWCYTNMHWTHHHGIIFVHLGFSWNFLGLIFRIIGLVVFCQKIVDGLTDNFAVGLLVWDFTPEHVRLTTLWTIYCVLHRCIRLNSLTQTFPCCDSNLLQAFDG